MPLPARCRAALAALLLGIAPGCVGPGLEPPQSRGSSGTPDLPGPSGGDGIVNGDTDAGSKGETPDPACSSDEPDCGSEDAGR